jgi:hypothetical protein
MYSGNNSGGAGKAKSGMVVAQNHRLQATPEQIMGPGFKIDKNTIHDLSIGGDTSCGRQNHWDEMQLKM